MVGGVGDAGVSVACGAGVGTNVGVVVGISVGFVVGAGAGVAGVADISGITGAVVTSGICVDSGNAVTSGSLVASALFLFTITFTSLVHVFLYPFILALIVVSPSDNPVIFPSLTFAIFLSEEDHLTVSFLLPYFCTVIVSFCFSLISSLDLLKTGAFTTLTLQVYFFLPFFQVILAFPAFFAVTIPFLVTDATAFIDVEYFPLFSLIPFISRSILSPLEITQLDMDIFAAACVDMGTAGTDIATAIAIAIPLKKCFFI